jgi:hypothetical protein
MTTVLVSPDASHCSPPFIDYRTDDLAAFLDAAKIKETV